MRFFFTASFLLLLTFQLHAGTVDTVVIKSFAMNKSFKCVVVKPDNYNNGKQRYSVVYLLHGYDGWYANWITREPALKEYADWYQLLIVCPEGGKSSWYLDSPIDPSMKYETYIAKEVPSYIDKYYRTINDRKARAITGLSMGGHGALLIANRHSEKFGACGSMSGLMDLRQTSKSFDLVKRIGDTILRADNWEKYSALNFIENKPAQPLSIIIDCGIEDPFYRSNKILHEKMLQLKIAHDYIERPGKHEWNYWRNSIPYHLLFFSKFFNGNR